MRLQRGFRFRLKPTKSQREQLVNFSGGCRFIYNRGLEERKKTYETTGQTLSYYDQNNALTLLKKEQETGWLGDIHSQILQQALKDLNFAFIHFFRRVKQKEIPGYPRFKSKGIKDSFRYPQGVKIESDSVYLPKIGWVRFRKSRDIEGKLKQSTISRKGDHWYVSFSCEMEKEEPPRVPISEEKAIGIDVGLIHFAVCSTGKENKQTIIPPKKIFKTYLPRLRVLSRRLSKKQKGSNNWKKAKRQLARLYAKIEYVRDDFAHQLSTQVVKSHDVICVESLQISKMMKKGQRALTRSIADASWHRFFTYLKYKAQERGKHFVEVGKYFPSTQLCSSCGHKQKMGLSQRTFECESCHLSIGRDYNSSISIKAAGLSVLNACGAT